MKLSVLSGSAADDSGSVLVMVALWMTVLVAMMAFAIDAGNWWTHKRHLQTQADAAALAAGGMFGVLPCADSPILSQATKYSGSPGATFNDQLGGTPESRIHMQINSPTWFAQASPVDSTVATGGPCSTQMVDVKLTETDLPWFLRASRVVPFINAHARVELRQLQTFGNGAVPLGVPEQNAKHVYAQFVDESNSATIGTVELQKTGTDSSGNPLYNNAVTPFALQMSQANVGVRIMLSNNSSQSPTCSMALVSCFDSQAPNNGLESIRAWVQTGTKPVLQDATLTSGTCTAYFTQAGSGCTFGASAKVDATGLDPSGLTITAGVDGATNGVNSKKLTLSGGRWSATGFTVSAGGPHPVDIGWEETKGTQGGNTCNTKNNNPCKGSFGVVQREFVAGDRSGPIQSMQVLEGTTPGANSFPKCTAGQTTACTHSLTVQVSLTPSLQDASNVSDPLRTLRVGGQNQTQALDCDPAISNFKSELEQGCKPQYQENAGTACPSSTSTLWATAQPWPCVGIDTGNATNQVPAGLNYRILGNEMPGNSCPNDNHWNNFPNLKPTDPRIVQVFLTPYGAFSGSGVGTVPVTGFATFYITGWGGSGSGFDHTCPGDQTPATTNAGEIYGHFIKYVQSINNGGGGSSLCELGSLEPCIPVLVE